LGRMVITILLGFGLSHWWGWPVTSGVDCKPQIYDHLRNWRPDWSDW
jgi:hypothetical protein